jgi:ATP-dependent DNA helicase RecG
VQDKQILEAAKKIADQIIDADPQLNSSENLLLKNFLQSQKGKTAWSKIS